MAFPNHDQSEMATESGSSTIPSFHNFPQRYPAFDDLRRYQQLMVRAIEVFGDAQRASVWLSTPSNDFGGEVPLRVAQHDGYSLERFEPVFIRIEHGIEY